MRRPLTSNETGAVAVLFALLAAVVIGAGALAVDLGNAFARKRVAQTQADLAVLAGAAELPESSADAVNVAFEYLWSNNVLGQDDIPKADMKAQMTDPDRENGDIWVDEDGLLNVLTPPAAVDYALGGIFRQYGVNVQAYAQAGVFSPGKLAPFFIPYGCSNPSVNPIIEVKAPTNGQGNEPDPVLLEPMAQNAQKLPLLDRVDPVSVPAGATAAPRLIESASILSNGTELVALSGEFLLPTGTGGLGDVGAAVTIDGGEFQASGPSRTAIGEIEAGRAALTSSDADFTSDDEGSRIVVAGAGPGGRDLKTVIARYVDAENVEIDVTAAETVTAASVEITPGTVADFVTEISSVSSTTSAILAAPAPLDVQAQAVSLVSLETPPIVVEGDGFTTGKGPGEPAMVVAFVRGNVVNTVTVNGSAVSSATSLTVNLPIDVLQSPDTTWFVQVRDFDAQATGDSGKPWSFSSGGNNSVVVQVETPAEIPAGCGTSERGDFGLLDITRLELSGAENADLAQLPTRIDLNLSLGLDHALKEFEGTFPADFGDYAASDAACQAEGVLDNFANVSAGLTPDCLPIKPGNWIADATDGLITGGVTQGSDPIEFSGRLAVGQTEPCARPLRGPIRFPSDSWTINDDVFSCFTTTSTIGAAITSPGPTIIGEIVNSPRFQFVPVLWADVNPQNADNYYPIERFVGAFISEQQLSTLSGSLDALSGNGVVLDKADDASGQKGIERMAVIFFELDQLPEQVSYEGEVTDYIGGPKVVRLLK